MPGEKSAAPTPDSELPLVLIMIPLFPTLEALLSPRFRFLKLWESALPLAEFLAANAGEVRAVLCAPPPSAVLDAGTIAALPRLELVVTLSVGVEHIDLSECRRQGIAVANAGDAFAEDTADYAVGLLIDVLRGISASDRYVRRGLWPIKGEFPLSSKLGGKRVGIVGLGSIGSKVARRLEAFGCTIFYTSRTKKSSVPYKYFSNIHDLAIESDSLVLTCALTCETHHIISRDVMLALGKEGVIVNVGRGALVDEKELVRCLVQGEIRGVGLDVFENEPEVPEELFAMENVVLSSHKSVHTPESFSGLVQTVIGNLEAFFSNKPLISPVSQ